MIVFEFILSLLSTIVPGYVSILEYRANKNCIYTRFNL